MGTAEYGGPELPATVIRRIQSFLTPKEATKTTLLSKSWLAAWSTRSTIDLDESHFPTRSSYSEKKIDALVELATNTFRRYEESKLKIDTFRLCLKSDWYGLSGLTTIWTLKALEMGATNLTFRFEYGKGVYIPLDDIFGSESVVSLCLERSNIDLLKVIKCSGLKSLTLIDMEISSDSFFNVISCCPSIENLSLRRISCHYSGQNMIIGSLDHKLTSLALCDVGCQFQALFLDDMASKFPNLKDLTISLRLVLIDLDFFRRQEKIQIVISSPSLEILTFRMADENECYYNAGLDSWESIEFDVSAEFDVPGIRKFTFEGNSIPNMSFRSISGYQWESRIWLTHQDKLSTMWFCELSKFLAKLRPSKIHIYLRVNINVKSFDYRKRDIGSLNVLEVEDLTMTTEGLPTLTFQALLDGLFRICRPKMITLYDNNGGNDLFLCRALEQGMKVKSFLIQSQYMYGLRDLEEINVQKPVDSILDDDLQGRLRVQLKWKLS